MQSRPSSMLAAKTLVLQEKQCILNAQGEPLLLCFIHCSWVALHWGWFSTIVAFYCCRILWLGIGQWKTVIIITQKMMVMITAMTMIKDDINDDHDHDDDLMEPQKRWLLACKNSGYEKTWNGPLWVLLQCCYNDQEQVTFLRAMVGIWNTIGNRFPTAIPWCQVIFWLFGHSNICLSPGHIPIWPVSNEILFCLTRHST